MSQITFESEQSASATGVVKGLLLAPVSTGQAPQMISQGLAAIELADHIRELLRLIADRLRRTGADVELD